MKRRKLEHPRFLNRFTSLPVLLDILSESHLVLLDPDTWEDRNDAYYIERYKAEKKLKTVLALCFSKEKETFHHWKVFSAGSSGVCIEFDGERLIPHVVKQGIQGNLVRYKLISEVESTKPRIDDWPFLKRKPYKDEGEYRIVYENKKSEEQVKPIEIDISWINRITLSPWMPKRVSDSVIDILKAIPGCDKLKIQRSSLLENSRWKRAITPALKIVQE